MGRPSSLHEIFARVKIHMGLERFEAGSFFGRFSKKRDLPRNWL